MAFLALFGRDEDHAVGSTGTVDGRRTGVLEDLDRLNVVGVEVGERALGAVDDHKRRAGAVERSTAAENDGRRSARVTGDLLHAEASHGAGEGLSRIGVHTGGDYVFLDGSDGVRYLGAELAAAVGSNHGLGQHFVVFCQHDTNRLAVPDNFLRYIADAGDYEDVPFLGIRLHEVAVEVGHGAEGDGLSLDEDGSADHAQALRVEDDTPASLILLCASRDSRFCRIEVPSRQQKAACQQDERSHFQKSFHKVLFLVNEKLLHCWFLFNHFQA